MIIKNGMHKIKINDFSINFIEAIKSLNTKEKIFIWLSWGTSINSFYEGLINVFEVLDKNICKKIFFCLLDERFVSINHEDSNYKSIYNLFFSKLLDKKLINSNQIIKFDIDNNDTVKNYSQKIPKIDIALFWVWPDWHIASLFPNHKLLLSEENNYIEIFDSPKPPTHRITISKNMINNINYSFVFFMWEKKKDAFNAFLNENLNYLDLPVKLVKNSKNYFIITDINNFHHIMTTQISS